LIIGKGDGVSQNRRAAIALLAPASQRGTAYGIFNAAYGLDWFAGSSLLGVLYDWSAPALAAVSVLLQGAALAILWRVLRSPPGRPATRGPWGKCRRLFRHDPHFLDNIM
jgi:hypothetical protein